MDLLILVLIILVVLALVGGYAVNNLIWLLALILLVVLIWRLMVGRGRAL